MQALHAKINQKPKAHNTKPGSPYNTLKPLGFVPGLVWLAYLDLAYWHRTCMLSEIWDWIL